MSKPPWEFPLWGPMLAPLGAVYGAFMAYRRQRYFSGRSPQHRFAVPVISVGNLTVGGVGKTPLVACILRLLEKTPNKCVLTRGYGASVAATGLSDESHMLQCQFPATSFVQGKDRIAAAQAHGKDAEVFILDDGAQHLQIARDLEILVFDIASLARPRFKLPAGPWRENLSAADGADFLILSRVDQADDEDLTRARKILRGRFPKKKLIESRHKTVGLSDAQGKDVDLQTVFAKSVLAVSGIGNPTSFAKSLAATGAHVAARLDFQDHASFGAKEAQRIRSVMTDLKTQFLITTEKDVAKVAPTLPADIAERLLVLRIEMDLGEGEQALLAALRNLGLR